MSEPAIIIENLSKQYRLGVVGTGTLSHDLKRWWVTNIRGKEDPYLKIGEVNDRSHKGSSDYVWALKDINLEVQQGEVLGIIGKNGAGKSTLLKILSRVTRPSTGSIRYRGRIASLLEVGTGFHPEMTGRENIFMNGAIMGMSKAEIRRKFDEIVDFAGVERYIETPVKRYSSGMTVRLGFAIAAHLEPEILVVDEVLAVGDAEFQKKAIGKMQDVSKGQGRTVLFVSHNMPAVRSLCTRTLMLSAGCIEWNGETASVINKYLNADYSNIQRIYHLEDIPRERGELEIRFKKLTLNKQSYIQDDNIEFNIQLTTHRKKITFSKLIFGIHVVDMYDQQIYHVSNKFIDDVDISHNECFGYAFRILHNSLKGGIYRIFLWLSANGVEQDFINTGLFLKVEDGNIYNYYQSDYVSGIVQPLFDYRIINNVE